MYALQIFEEASLLKLTVEDNLDEDQLREMLKDLKHTRRKFNGAYRLLIVLPNMLRAGNIDEREKIDLNVFLAKLKGLKQVILQTPEKGSANVERLKQIYSGLSIKVSVTHNEFETDLRLERPM